MCYVHEHIILVQSHFLSMWKKSTFWRNIHLWIERQCFWWWSGWAQIKLSWHFLPDIWVCLGPRLTPTLFLIPRPTGERQATKSNVANQLKAECSNTCPALADLFTAARYLILNPTHLLSDRWAHIIRWLYLNDKTAVERKALGFFCQDLFCKINPCPDLSSVPCCCLFSSLPLHFFSRESFVVYFSPRAPSWIFFPAGL